jgi:hypothetical protein
MVVSYLGLLGQDFRFGPWPIENYTSNQPHKEDLFFECKIPSGSSNRGGGWRASNAPEIWRSAGKLAARWSISWCFLNGLGCLRSGNRNASSEAMSTNPINGLSNSYLQSILSSTLQNAGLTASTANNTLNGVASSTQSDNGQISSFAKVMSTLQQLQQSDPAKYQQVTRQIATNLQSAAQTAQAEGNTSAATQLNELSTDFTTASQNGQLPNMQDLAKAMAGHHHHHGHFPAETSSDASSNSSSSTSSSSSNASQMLSQLVSAFQANGVASQSDTLNPMSIILSTLSSAGVSGTNQ